MEKTNNQRFDGVSSQIRELQTRMGNNHRVLNNNMRAYGGRIEGSLVRQRRSNQGTRFLTSNQADQAGPLREVNLAKLSSLPRHLMVLWREYMFGLNNSKPAKDFTSSERNACRQKYYRRNIIWKVMERQVRSGLTPKQACAELRHIYGHRTSITDMMDLIVKDRKRYGGGDHPNHSV